MKNYFHTLLALFFIVVNDCWCMNKEKKLTVTEIPSIEKIPNYLSTEETEALADIIKMGIKIKNIEKTSENKIRELDLSGNTIKDLALLVKKLKNIPHLFVLHLNDCGIENVTPLKELTQLKKLYLNNNNIKKIPDLKDLTDLTVLDLSNNKVKIDSKDKDKLNKKIKLIYSVEQDAVSTENKEQSRTKSEPKKLNPQLLKQKQIITLQPKKLEQNQAPKQVILKAKTVELKTKTTENLKVALESFDSTQNSSPIPKNNNAKLTDFNLENKQYAKIKNLDDKDNKKKNIASGSKSNIKNSNSTPGDDNNEFKKENSKKTTSSYMDLFNKYKNWIVAGLTVTAIGGSAYLYNRLKKQKKVD